MKKCIKCGFQNEDSAFFCENCGRRLEQAKSQEEPAKKSVPKRLWLWIGLLALAIVVVTGVIIILITGEDEEKPKKPAEDIIIEAEPEEEAEEGPEIIINTPIPISGIPTQDPPSETPIPTLTPTPEAPIPEEQEDVIIGSVSEQEMENTETESADLEEQIQDIRDIYYGIQYNLDDYTVQDGGGGTARYLDSQGNIVKISAEKGTYADIATGDDYAAEYYYEIVNGEYHLRFVFIWGNGEEYRIYLNRSSDCIRFIDPAGVTYDNEAAASQLSSRTDLSAFCSQAQREIAMAFGG